MCAINQNIFQSIDYNRQSSRKLKVQWVVLSFKSIFIQITYYNILQLLLLPNEMNKTCIYCES